MEHEEKHDHKEEHKKRHNILKFNFKHIQKFFSKYGIIFLILIPIFFSIFLRMTPAYIPITDDWAENNVYSTIQSQLMADISSQSPHLPTQKKQELANEKLKVILEEGTYTLNGQTVKIDDMIRQNSDYLKTKMQDDDGQTYLLAIDPYYFMRHSSHYIENGQAGTIMLDESNVGEAQKIMHPDVDFSKPVDWDGQRMAPVGAPTKMALHTYFESYLYKFVSIFNKDVSLMAVIFLVPIIISALAVIPAFFIGRKVGGNVGGFFSAMIIAVHAVLVGRTAGGFSDTDAYNFLLPLMIIWMFLIAFEEKDTKKQIIYTSLAGFFTGLFAFAWQGWWYGYGLVLGTLAIYLVYHMISNLKESKKGISGLIKNPRIKEAIMILLIFVVASGFFVTLFTNFSTFSGAITKPIKMSSSLKGVGLDSVWPNIRTTVAELNEASIKTIVKQIGGTLLFLLAMIGVLLTLLKKDKEGKIDIKYFILLSIWFIGSIYASTKGVRFILLAIPALSIAIGAFAGLLYKYIPGLLSKELYLDKRISKSVLIVLLIAVLLISPTLGGYVTSKRELPSMNDAWYDTLTGIKEDSAPDAIINSWWDFGHWFITIADRPVTFDGSGQDRHMAHWIGKSLLVSDEKHAMGILRMVDCGNNNAFWVLDDIINDTARSIDILNEIIVLDKENASISLTKYIDGSQVDSVLKYTHCEPPEDYYITSKDMVGKSGVWAHFGSWDFNKATIYNKLRNMEEAEGTSFLKSRFNYSDSDAKALFYDVKAIRNNKEANNWIAPWPGYANQISCTDTGNKTLSCGGIFVDLNTLDVWLETANGILRPKNFAIPLNNEFFVLEFEENIASMQNGRPLGLGLMPVGNNKFKLLTMDAELTGSMFTRLFYYHGLGMDHFDLFSYKQSFDGQDIMVWKVDWDGIDDNETEEINEIEEVSQPEELISEDISDGLEENVSDNTTENVSDVSILNTNDSSE